MLEKIFKRQKQPNTSHGLFEPEIDMNKIPHHVAIIMDGNGRWAKQRNLPRIMGHKEGMNVVKDIVKVASNLGIKELTLYAFSTENWKRPKTEVDFLMKLPEEFLGAFLPELVEENVQVKIMGQEEELPSHTRSAIHKAVKETAANTGMILNFALNYGSRNEIINGIKKIAEEVKIGKIDSNEITDELFSQYLLSSEMKDPDLLIRTSGEIRLSNFMLWQAAYSELWFSDVLWPDFTSKHFLTAIIDYQKRSRRFGGV